MASDFRYVDFDKETGDVYIRRGDVETPHFVAAGDEVDALLAALLREQGTQRVTLFQDLTWASGSMHNLGEDGFRDYWTVPVQREEPE